MFAVWPPNLLGVVAQSERSLTARQAAGLVGGRAVANHLRGGVARSPRAVKPDVARLGAPAAVTYYRAG